MKLRVITCFLFASLGQAFLPISRSFLPPTSLRVTSEEYAEEEFQEMRELVLSISLEPTDHDRRTRLRDVFHEALSRPNGAPKRFTGLFDMILVKVGDEIQMEAKKKYFEKQAEEKELEVEENEKEVVVEEAESAAANADDPQAKKGLQFKSPEEFQLWALVDMMVQSKTIVKKSNGELGSKGTFQ
mmetsp:Transcript_129909/g.193382  ORF Transcript_129909/g.193382 Transcript_129909/m.193382 type:complete len:186 (+) Transcript_129909:139-696(+)|eukprot:CAMPEP_0117033348 /NCGR_PEP_ID=MMETSP0472-20121206/23836_1 /TAXON_ID=693140 ORGANISM="Tiarina fusus, Strain LIS" /NCGR_SAMPLE_ID=MMETSP0472 /ASSEMBLY_ACC=CAM_ASM_000603 /LENGTH=185 /DNA_ID=CAMNT_0004742243 /DNA_START=128 /DNA_END=685 /DNA_ORIENTATION=+